MGHKPIAISEVLNVLHILQSEQEPNEKTPVGGHGAGIAYLSQKGTLTLTKVAKTNSISPVNDLRLQLGETANNSSSLILGHVRRASPEFIDTIQYKECTQPYKPSCTHNFNLVSAHNGKIQNYLDIKNKLSSPHQFESQKIKLNDSEVIPHLFEELLTEFKNPRKAAHTLFEQIEGTETQGNTVVILQTKQKEARLNAIQKGKTRGLLVWTNPNQEIILCSRQKPIQKVLNKFLPQNNFQKIIQVSRNNPVNLEAHFTLQIPKTQRPTT